MIRLLSTEAVLKDKFSAISSLVSGYRGSMALEVLCDPPIEVRHRLEAKSSGASQGNS